jgi:regulator of cell morphogenesis and NO signaling
MGIDYCCGGKRDLEEACREKGLDSQTLLLALEEEEAAGGDPSRLDTRGMSLSQLADHIEQTHHVYLRSELPRLYKAVEKVSSLHGGRDPRLLDLRGIFLELAEELSGHMMKEEYMLFPMIRKLEGGCELPETPCGTLAHPIGQMELEHDQVGAALKGMHALTDGFTPPDWACLSYREMLQALVRLQDDLHQHIHKENNVLFPRALDLEERKRLGRERVGCHRFCGQDS